MTARPQSLRSFPLFFANFQQSAKTGFLVITVRTASRYHPSRSLYQAGLRSTCRAFPVTACFAMPFKPMKIGVSGNYGYENSKNTFCFDFGVSGWPNEHGLCR
ncbi:hypothetical protein CA54_02490 [Symmachiella macrocystis]|uniref:Uncharacterized protein n=1 Tax=Symmachiella macrocystis TaxID=2527985 RepID=A0A5C6BIA4_9PLAN|nr:hypothetical protein CA54_02490 [Symmachiella macrocystis]